MEIKKYIGEKIEWKSQLIKYALNEILNGGLYV